MARPVLFEDVMQKKTALKKLSVDVSTIRIISREEEKQVIGGAPYTMAGCSPQTQTCSIRQPGCP